MDEDDDEDDVLVGDDILDELEEVDEVHFDVVLEAEAEQLDNEMVVVNDVPLDEQDDDMVQPEHELIIVGVREIDDVDTRVIYLELLNIMLLDDEDEESAQ